MYSMGVPIGLFVDHRGPRPAVIVGSILLGLGYYPFQASYDNASGSVPLMCFFSYLTGLGGCMAFAASVKTSALNWPHHRGTATAFPLAAFGLSAFFFSVFGDIFFPGNTSAFLMFLAVGTFGLTFVGFFFLRVYPHGSGYHSVPNGAGGLSDSQQLRRTSSDDVKRIGRGFVEPESGRSSPITYTTPAASTQVASEGLAGIAESSSSRGASSSDRIDIEATLPSTRVDEPDDVDETSSLVSKSSSLPGDVLVQDSIDMDRSHRIDIRGWRLLRNIDFWQLFSIMGILAGIGLMTIK